MKSVLISIQPKWCELIASGKKTVEIRKTKPKLDAPFKVYIYETKAYDTLFGNGKPKKLCVGGGKVIGEFVCNNIDFLDEGCLFEGLDEISNSRVEEDSCLTIDELLNYKGDRYEIYGWHISDLVIYDKPKELSEFRSYNVRTYLENGYPMPTHELKRPPQSWCYVEKGCIE